MTDEPTLVTQETCRTKHRALRGLMAGGGVVAAIVIGAVFILPLFALTESKQATDAVTSVAQEFGKHAAAQESHEDHLHESLNRIRATMEKIDEKVDEIRKAVNRK